MANEKPDVSKYEENYGVVIFLDALGMKGIWKNKDPKDTLEHWNWFVTKANEFLQQYGQETKIESSMYAFSDTAIITIKKTSVEKLILKAAEICAAIIEVEMLREIYFRGCISVGKFYEHKDGAIILGPAVDEAAQYYSLPNLIGVYTAPSAYSVIERLGDNKEVNRLYIKYDIPLKDKIYKNGWMIKYNMRITKEDVTDLTNEAFKQMTNLREIAHYNLEHLDNVDAAEKWKNTLELMNFIIKNN